MDTPVGSVLLTNLVEMKPRERGPSTEQGSSGRCKGFGGNYPRRGATESDVILDSVFVVPASAGIGGLPDRLKPGLRTQTTQVVATMAALTSLPVAPSALRGRICPLLMAIAVTAQRSGGFRAAGLGRLESRPSVLTANQQTRCTLESVRRKFALARAAAFRDTASLRKWKPVGCGLPP